MTVETTAQQIIDDAYAEDINDREFVVHSVVLLAALENFMAIGRRTGRDNAEFCIAQGLFRYLEELVHSVSITSHLEYLLKQAADSVCAYIAAADLAPAARAAGLCEPPCDVEAQP